MKISRYPKGSVSKRLIALKILALSVILMILLSNCSVLGRNLPKENQSDSFQTQNQASQTQPSTLRGPQGNQLSAFTTETPTNTSSLTSTVTPTLSDIEWYERYHVIDTTQNPPIISTVPSPGRDYLYKNAVVTFDNVGLRPGGFRYLNLDDLQDSSPNNSDVLIQIAAGTAGTYFYLYPVNFARYYFSGKSNMNYDSCISEFPANSNYANSDEQPQEIVTSKPFCVLTNEGHMGVIYAVKDSMIPNENASYNLSLVVTVYSKKALQIFTPAPTITPGPSPTPTGWYSGANLTSEQGKALEDQIIEFQNALAARDVETLSNFIDYPLSVNISGSDLTQVNNQADFYSNFDELFPKSLVEEISQANISNSIMSSQSGVYISVNDARIWFGADGKIDFIDYWGE